MKKILLLTIVLLTSGCTIAQKQAWNGYKLHKSITTESQQWITEYNKLYFQAEDSSNMFWVFDSKNYSKQENQFCERFKQNEWISSANTKFFNIEPSCALLKNSGEVNDGLLIKVRTKFNFWSRYWYVDFIDINSQEVIASTDFIQADPAKLDKEVIDRPLSIYQARITSALASRINNSQEESKLKLREICDSLSDEESTKECSKIYELLNS